MALEGGQGQTSRKTGWLLVAVLIAAACRTVTPDVTAVRVVATWDSEMHIDQLAIELQDQDGEMLGPRELRPRMPSSPLESGADVIVYLPDALGGQTLKARIQGLLAGAVVAAAEAQIEVATSRIVSLPMTFGGSPRDGGAADGLGPPRDAEAGPDGGPSLDGPPLLTNGAACTSAGQCRSGHCTDGFCCESASCGPCRACNIQGTLGLCRNSPAGTVCEQSRCHSSGDGVVREDLCDGAGICVNKGTQSCSGYRCNPSNFTCYTSCTDDSQCSVGRACRSGRCEM